MVLIVATVPNELITSRLVVVGERVQFLPNGNGNGHSKAANEPEGAEAPVGEEVPF